MKGNRIREHRTRAGLTQLEVAERSGLHVITVCRLEGGHVKNPSLETLQKLASTLGCELVALLPAATERVA